MAKVKLGIIGVGNMGTGHSKNYLDGLMPEIEITAVADRNPARREWAKENLPGVKVFEEGVDLIHSGACEAVLIAISIRRWRLKHSKTGCTSWWRSPPGSTPCKCAR